MDICCLEECGANSVQPMLVAPRCDDGPVAFYPCLPTCTKTYYCCEKPKSKQCHKEEASYRKECCSHHKMERRACSPPNNHQDCFYMRPPSPRPVCCEPQCKPSKTKYIIPCYRYEDGRIVHKLPVTAFKRNGMQDQEHGKVQGATNFLQRCPRDVELECDACPKIKVCDPAKVPVCDGKPTLVCQLLKKPIKSNQPTVLMRRACEVAVGKRPRKKPYEESRFIRDADHQETRYIKEDEEGNCCFHFEKQKHQYHTPPFGQCASCPQYCMEYPPFVTARLPSPTPPPRNCYYHSCYNPC